jgi:hypothetical protein
MSSIDSDIEDMFDDENDSYIMEWKMKREQEMKSEQDKKKIQPLGKKILQRGEINENLVNQLFSNPEYQNYVDQYINQGMELNRAIRNREQLSESYKLLLSNLNKLSKQVQQIFPNTDYIKVCRMMSQHYNIDSPLQPISTASICLSGFGNKTLHIYIPKDSYILIKDISKTSYDPITRKMVKTFEIIIPPLTPKGYPQKLLALDNFTEDDYVRYYVVNSPYSNDNFQKFIDIYKSERTN